MGKKNKGFRRRSQLTKSQQTNRSSKRKCWTDQQMLAALESVKAGLSANRSAELHGVPPSILKDGLNGRVKHGTKPGPAPYLTSKEEAELSMHLISLSKMGLGKTRRDVKQIAEAVATQKGVMKADRISDGWWRRFLERNPALSLRCGDSTAGVRMDAINHRTINNYFDLLKEIMDEFHFEAHPEAIDNMDETGVPLDPHPPKVVAARGQKKVRYRSCGQKSQLTVIACGSATGQVIPPSSFSLLNNLIPCGCKTRSLAPGMQ